MMAVVGTTIAVRSTIKDSNVLALNRTVNPDNDYTLVLDHTNPIKNDNSVNTALGNKVYFATEGVLDTPASDAWLKYDENTGNVSFYNTTEILGMKSISVVVDDQYKDIGLLYGYKEEGVIHYSNYYLFDVEDLGDGKYKHSHTFSEGEPSFFKVKFLGSEKTIYNVEIKYSCSDGGYIPTELSTFEFEYDSDNDYYYLDGLVHGSQISRDYVQTLIIPGYYDDGKHGYKPVSKIDDRACFGKTEMEYLYIEEGVVTLGDMAFAYCTNLKYMVLPSTIGAYNANVFEGCMELANVTIPAGTTNIDLLAFAGNQFITEITVAEGNSTYYSYSGMLFAYSYQGHSNALLVCPAGKKGNIVIPNDCTYISEVAFKNSKADTITIGSSVRYIDERFVSCTSLTEYIVDSNNHYFSTRNDMLCDSTGATLVAYPRGNTQPTLNIPNDVRNIEDHVFEKVNTLTSVNLMYTTNIGEGSFANMANLTTVTLSNVTTIGDGAFKNDKKLINVTLSDGLDVVSSEAFMGCTSLSSLLLPSDLTIIDSGAFKDCSSLSSINIPNALERIGGEAFMNCTSLDINSLPVTVVYIGNYVFRNTAIDDIFNPGSLTYIPEGMFMDCDSLTSIEIPEEIATIGYNAFNDCDGLSRVEFLDGTVSTIQSKAFYSCASLYHVYLPKCVKTIGASAFNQGRLISIYADISGLDNGDPFGFVKKPGWDTNMCGPYYELVCGDRAYYESQRGA